VVPEKQGLKPGVNWDIQKEKIGISGGSRKTRIETLNSSEPFSHIIQRYKWWFQKNKD